MEHEVKQPTTEEAIKNEVFRAVLMYDATRRQILKLPSITGVVIEFESDQLLIKVNRGKHKRVFAVKVTEQL